MLKSNVFLKGRAKQATANASQLDLNFRTFNSSSHPLVAWYDFTDIPTMYKDQSGTRVTASGQSIGRIKNKANPQPGAAYKLGTHLDQTTAGSKPVWTSDGTIAGSYGTFDGTDDFLVADRDTGNVDTNKLSDTILNGSALTAFWVAKADIALLGASECVFGVMDEEQSFLIAYVADNDDTWKWNTCDNVARTNTLLESVVDSTTVNQAWMVALKGDIGGGTSVMHKNGVKTGITDGDGDNYDFDLTANDADNCIMIGAVPTANAAAGAGTFWDGNISEVIIFDGLLAAEVYIAIVDYLTRKYGITRLN